MNDNTSIMMERIEMKAMFMEKIQSMIKASNSYLIESYEKYQQIIEEVELAKETKSKTALQYRRIKRYDVMNVGDVKKLIRPLSEDMTEIKYFVPNEELFDVIHNMHLECNHAGRDIMLKSLAKKYANITREAVTCYLDLCLNCQKKRKETKRGFLKNPKKPISSEVVNSRGQINFIDMDTVDSTSGFRYILKYQDQISRFIMLKGLKSNAASEVAYALSDIFCTIGAPSILHVINNDLEFVNMITDEVRNVWPDMIVIYCKPSQTNAGIPIQEIKNFLYAWMEDNNTKNWSECLRFYQLMKNISHYHKKKKTPFDAMFGRKGMEMPSPSISASQEIQTEEHSEEPMEEESLLSILQDDDDESEKSDTPLLSKNVEVHVIKMPDDTELQAEIIHVKEHVCCICGSESSGLNKCHICHENVHINCSKIGSSLEEGFQSIIVCLNCGSKQPESKNIERDYEELKLDAENSKMIQSSEKPTLFPIGKTVLVHIPSSERNKMDVCNILGVVMYVTKEGLYKIGTKNGVLKSLFNGNQLKPCKKNLVNITEVPDTVLSIRELMVQNAAAKGQTIIKCYCSFKCSTNACKCKRLKMLCNSKCHHSRACCNK